MATTAEQVQDTLTAWFRATDDGKRPGCTAGRPSPPKRARRDSHDGGSLASSSAGAASLCQPWSSDQFVERVQTYSLARWFGKPFALSPLQCSRYGWVCSATKPDTLSCPSCAALLQVSFAAEIEGDEEAMRGVCEQYVPKLNDAHKPLCAWRDNACPDSFTQVRLRCAHRTLRFARSLTAHLRSHSLARSLSLLATRSSRGSPQTRCALASSPAPQSSVRTSTPAAAPRARRLPASPSHVHYPR